VRKEQRLPALILAFIAVSIGLGSCDRAQDCIPTTRDYLVLQLVDSTGKARKDTLTVSSYSSSRITRDTISSNFNLILDPLHDTITYRFSKPGNSNWIKVGYNSTVNVPSEDCGPEFAFFQLEVLDTSYDSIRVLDRTFSKSVKVNIRVYYE